MGGGRHRASTSARPPTPAPPTRHSRTPHPSVIPAQAGTRAPNPSFLRPKPSFLRRQEPPPPPNPTPPFPNSSLPPFRGEARWGVESTEPPPAPAPPHPHPSFPRPHPSFLRRQEPPRPPTPHPPFPNSSLPPFRGEARWGVESTEPPPAPAPPHPPSFPPPSSVIPAPQSSFLRRQEPRQGERGAVGACPYVLLPQHTIVPSVLIAHVCCEPALTAV